MSNESNHSLSWRDPDPIFAGDTYYPGSVPVHNYPPDWCTLEMKGWTCTKCGQYVFFGQWHNCGRNDVGEPVIVKEEIYFDEEGNIEKIVREYG